MKKIFLIVFTLNILFPLVSKAQQEDPILTGAVVAQTLVLQEAYDKRNEKQNMLIATQGAVTIAMDRIHNVESKVLEYMSNASAAMDNLYQLKTIAEYVGEKIPTQVMKLGKAVPDNLQGTAVSALTSRAIMDVTTEMTSLYGFVAQLVTSTKFTLGKGNENAESDKKNVNLLSAAERYYIASEVEGRVKKIYRKLWLLTWQIENFGWEDLLHRLDPKLWGQVNHGKAISQRLIKQWNRAKDSF